jgi:serine/threonine-protein kinase
MSATLTITAGPHEGKSFTFDQHDTFLVGRSKTAHLQLSYDDPYFGRKHFMVEFHPPRCRVIDLGSRNGTFVNGQRVTNAELKDGDEIKAGHTVFKLTIPPPDPDEQVTYDLPLAASPPPAVATIDHPKLPGLAIEGFEVGPVIGRGAMGVVYKAQRVGDPQPVAIKVISPLASTNQRMIDKFLRESRMMDKLLHPNIVRFYEANLEPPVIYLVMEFVDGPDASQMVKEQGPLPVAAAVRLTHQVLTGLAEAHELGIVHRDVKPANILVGGPKGKRVAKLADFGFARLYDECQFSGLTFLGDIGGTPAYMAPEQVTHLRDAKPPADQYAAAATLYNLLTGATTHQFPKDAISAVNLLVNQPPVPIRDRRPEIPEGLAAVIHKALAKEPGGRFANVIEFRQALLPYAAAKR